MDAEEKCDHLLQENEWLVKQLHAVRSYHRENTDVNYDNSLKFITDQHTATGRWSEQRQELRREAKMKDDIIDYFTGIGIPPESTEWSKMLVLWKEHLEIDSIKQGLRDQVDEALLERDDAEEACVKLEQQNQGFHQLHLHLKSKLLGAHHETEDVRDQHNNLAQDHKRMLEVLEQKELSHKKLSKTANTHKDLHNELNERLMGMQAKEGRLQSEHTGMLQQIDAYERKLQEQNDTIAAHQKVHNELNQRLMGMKAEDGKLHVEHTNMLQQIDSEHQRHLQQIEAFEQKRRDLDQTLSVQATENTQNIAELEQCKSDLRKMDEHNQRLNEDFMDLNRELGSQKSEGARARSAQEALSQELGQLRNSALELKGQNEQLHAANDNLSAKMDYESAAFGKRDKENMEAVEKLHDQMQQMEKQHLEAMHAMLLEEQGRFKVHLAEVNDLQQSRDQQSKMIEDLQAALQETAANFERMRQEKGDEHGELLGFKRQFDIEIGALEATLAQQKKAQETAAMAYENQIGDGRAALAKKAQELRNVMSEKIALEAHYDNEQRLLAQVDDMTASISDLEMQHMAERQTIGGALAAKNDELAASRLAFQEERKTFMQALEAEQRNRLRALEEAEAEATLQIQGLEGQLAEAQREIEFGRTRAENAEKLRVESEDKCNTLTTKFDKEQQLLTNEFSSHVDQTEVMFTGVVDKLKKEHLGTAKALEARLLIADGESSRLKQAYNQLNDDIDQLVQSLGSTRAALSLSDNRYTEFQVRVEQDAQTQNQKLGAIYQQHRLLADEASGSNALVDKLRLEAVNAAHASQREKDEMKHLQASELQQYGATVSQLQGRLNQTEVDLRAAQHTVDDLQRQNEALHDDLEARRVQFEEAAERERAQIEANAREFDLERRHLLDEASIQKDKYTDLCHRVASRYHDYLRMGVNDTLNQSMAEAVGACTPEEQLGAIFNGARQKDERIRQLADSLEGVRDALSNTEQVNEQLRSRIALESEGARSTTEKMAATSEASRQAEARFNQMLSSVRKGFEQEKGNFQQQIAAARVQTLQTAEDLSAARDELRAKEEQIEHIDKKLRVSLDTVAGLEKQSELHKLQVSKAEHRVQDLRTELARNGSELSVMSAELRTETSRRSEAEARAEACRTELQIAEETADKLHSAVANAGELQHNTEATLARAKLQCAGAEETYRIAATELVEAKDTCTQQTQMLVTLQDEARVSQATIAELSAALNQARVEGDLVAKLRSQLATGRQLMEDQTEQHEATMTELNDELMSSNSLRTRQKRNNAERQADLERQLAQQQNKALRATRALEAGSDKHRKLRNQLSDMQVEQEGLKETAASLRRAETRAQAAVAELEGYNAQLKSENLSLADQVDRAHQKMRGKDSLAKSTASKLAIGVQSQLQSQDRARVDMERVRNSAANATKRDFERKISAMQDQVRGLNTSMQLDRSTMVSSTPRGSPTKGV
jgi:chromosome segregation ATPase